MVATAIILLMYLACCGLAVPLYCAMLELPGYRVELSGPAFALAVVFSPLIGLWLLLNLRAIS